MLDQKPPGTSSRSNLATWLGIMGLIRDAFAKSSGEKAALFSFNSAGRCPECEGRGEVAVLVVSAVDGVQAHTETIFRLLEEYSVPTIIFINKNDRPDTSLARSMADLQRLDSRCMAWQGLNHVEGEGILALP